MPWVRLDDGFVDHPKVARVGPIGAWIQIQALCYCNKNLTDGFIPFGIARSFAARNQRLDERQRIWEAGEHCGMQGLDMGDVDWPTLLCEVGMWEPVDGGYVIHDFKDYQPTKAEVIAEREATRQRVNKLRGRQRNGPCNGVTNAPVTVHPVPVPGSQEDLISLASLARVPAPGFEEFWARYPQHVGKEAARKAWAKLGPSPPLGAIVDALAWQRTLPRWREERGRFVPHPATYLNGRRWEDERPPLTALERLNAELG